MPRAEILSKQAMHTLSQLHAELAGKIEGNRKSGDKLRAQMVQVEAVMKMLDPDFNARSISAKRRNTGNPWFKRGTLYRAVIDTLRRAERPMTADDICKTLLVGKSPAATGKQENNLQAAILAALRKRKGAAVIGEGFPARWRLKASPST
ncbi:hypothetical protein [Bradyrhizobium sp. dw_78]|uniref:hypothetical protein n=1 Tax=Bradyrhizobium sp. dw_78 TaxID=2719793 RepID=UPI001BD616EC|nr:hypothetical protein [Bradyrhizobium sp. dw_78]